MSIDNPVSPESTSINDSISDSYSITDESIYYIAALIFAVIISVSIAIVGISWLLPVVQSVALTLFMFPLLRRGRAKRALTLLGSWLLLQFIVIMFLSMAMPSQMEETIADGFNRRTEMLAWFYAMDPPPAGLVDSLGSRLVEILVMVIGSIATAGLIGFWLLVRGVNLAAFYSGAILAALSDTASGIGAFPIWTTLRLAGYGLLTFIAAGTLTNPSHSIITYIRKRRVLLLIMALLILSGLLFEFTLPNIWRGWFS